MIPLNPLFLWFLPLAALPILFHLFFKVKKRTRIFPSLLFFQRADPRLSSRKKIREWLTLLLRMLLIALLLLALARLLLLGRGSGGPVAAVLVVDNSGSMQATGEDGNAKLTRALAGAAALISDMGEQDVAGIVTLVRDPLCALDPSLTSDKKKLHAALNRIRETDASGSPAEAYEQACAMLDSSAGSRVEIHVFTDLQAHEWQTPPSSARQPPPGTAVQVHTVRTTPRVSPNVAVAALSPPPRRWVAGRSLAAGVTLHNETKYDARVRLHAVTDSDVKSSQLVDVPPYGVKAVGVPLTPQSADFHWLKVWVEEDAFRPDNTAYMGYRAHGKLDVALVGGREHLLLSRALSPAGNGLLSGLAANMRGAEETAQALLAAAPAMVAISWAEAAQAGRHKAYLDFVENGGVLLVVPGPGPEDPAGAVPDGLGAQAGPAQENAEGLALIAFEKTSTVWDDLRDDQGDILLRNVRVFRFRPLKPANDATALMGLEDGRVLLTEKTLGKGRIFCSGIAFETAWSTLPLKGGFVALVQGMALGQPTADDVVRCVAGETLPELCRGCPSLRVLCLNGTPLEWEGPPSQLTVLPRSGIYAVSVGDVLTYVAVSSSPMEGQESFLQSAPVPALASVAHTVTPLARTEDLLQRVHRRRSGIDLYLPLLLLALIAVAAEGIVANPVPRTKPGPAPSQPEVQP